MAKINSASKKSAKETKKVAIVDSREIQIELFKNAYDSNKPFEKYIWKTVCQLNIAEFAERIDSSYEEVKSARVIGRRREKDKKLFFKIEIEKGNSKIVEWELSYDRDNQNGLAEGDVLDLNTVLLCRETAGTDEEGNDISHFYAVGEVL